MIVILGALGMVGSSLSKVLREKGKVVRDVSHEELDITDFKKAREFVRKIRPDVVINCAAYHKVDECEENPEKSFLVNSIAVLNLARVCREVGCEFVHFSTDYVFDGKKGKPYVEDDKPNPLNVYGVSKLAGEIFVRNTMKKYYIIRTSGIFGVARKVGKENFVSKMLRLAREGKKLRIVNDQIFSPTYALDLAKKIAELLETRNYGIYHITNTGSCSWYELACKAFENLGIKANATPVSTEEFGAKAKRPKYSVLDHKALREIGLEDTRSWELALKDYLNEIT